MLKAAARATAKDSTSALAELANEAYVPDLHASQHHAKKEGQAAAAEAERKGTLASVWDHVKGFFAGILAVIITHLYMVRSAYSFPVIYLYPVFDMQLAAVSSTYSEL